MERGKIKQLSFRVDESLHRRLKTRAAADGKTLTELIVEVLEKHLEDQKDK